MIFNLKTKRQEEGNKTGGRKQNCIDKTLRVKDGTSSR